VIPRLGAPFSLLVDAVPETLPGDYSMRACEITVLGAGSRVSMLILRNVPIFKIKRGRFLKINWFRHASEVKQVHGG
jgi:hypothetical protein